MDKFLAFCKEHKFTIIFVWLGLLIAILFMTIGFWRTLLMIVLIAVFFLLGYLFDKGGFAGIQAFFSKLFSRKSK